MPQYGGWGVSETLENSLFLIQTLVQISGGAQHSLALTDQGQIWGFGSNSHGQLGLKESEGGEWLTPRRIQWNSGPSPSFILAAGQHSIALSFHPGQYYLTLLYELSWLPHRSFKVRESQSKQQVVLLALGIPNRMMTESVQDMWKLVSGRS